jgi:Ca2+/Na+ antiporter
MIVGWLRLAVVGFLVLTLVYWLVSVYSRSLRREALEEEWEAGDHAMDRAQFVEEGLRAYQGSLRRRLILLVYVVPAIVVPAIIYIMNFD